jgi:hypothetical protein
LMGRNEDKLNDEFLQAIKDMKSTMGNIEQRLDAKIN